MEYYEGKISIKAWAEEDRPREKLIGQGRRNLTDAELIAILIGSGSRDESAVELSKRILHHYKNDLNALGKASVAELCKFKGIGEAKAISIVAALELGRRRDDTEVKAIEKIGSSRDAYQLFYPLLADLNHEEFWIMLMNKGNKIIGTHLISKGGLATTIADPKIIFQISLEHHAASVILAHNHPSGNLKPSAEDLSLTKKIIAGGKLLDITIFDHIIITDQAYYSFADEGVL
ncbi:RadC family protein [Mucilaginibacter paludis]|uniref:DNA repair protein RadC n=1 Tax=Mucilaginibacter paludis DSM 18603 TaxID=714943 RepID=H1Y0F4_9SPHI|nr:DNA repair protein RadC [Mucilaginibacter paludis]EHQ28421.1 DNA repair protein RadC [Mucilaginibacter paludis DSM 18603]